MSSRYLLPCQCGKSIPVEISQAGQSLTCECGQSLQAPTMREIRRLQPAGDDLPQTRVKRSGGWSPVQGALFFIGAVIFLGAAAAIVLLALMRSPLPTDDPFPDSERQEEAAMAKMDIARSWDVWQNIKQIGLGPQMPPEYIQARRVYNQLTRMIYIAAAALAAGVGLVAAALLIRPPNRRR